MNVLFLDFDGVINTPVGIDEKGNIIDDYYPVSAGKVNNFVAVKLIEKLCRKYNLRIVVQSRGWRNFLGLDENGNVRYRPYRDYLKNSGMDESLVEGHVPYLSSKEKGDEIDEYLSTHKVDKFIVIDDNDNNGVDKSLVRFGDNLIVCDGNRGFTEVEFKQAEEILSRENRYRVKNVEDEQK